MEHLDHVLVERQGNRAELTLNRPEKLNALTSDMCATLTSFVESAAASGIRAILLTGAGRGFCTGQDLGEKDPASGQRHDMGQTLIEDYNPLVQAIQKAPIPIVCAVNGPVAGAGVGLALACDITLAAEGSKFLLPFSRIGLAPGAGLSWMLPRLIGPARAKALVLLAEPVTARQAVEIGLIWREYPADSLLAEARTLTDRLANGPTYGLGAAKTLLNSAFDHDLTTQLSREAEAQTGCGFSRDYAEGVAAFRAKRAAEFCGEGPDNAPET